MNRRELLTATAATATVGLIPGTVHGTPTDITRSKILGLYFEIIELEKEAGNYDTGLSGRADDYELDRLFYNRRDALAAEMMELPSTCAADFAAKVIIDTAEGGCFSDWKTGPLWIEARALVGARD